MATTVIVHVMGDDPLVAEMEKLPQPSDQALILLNPRQRDNKPLRYLERETISMILPMHRVNFVEITPSQDTEEVDLFFRA